MRLPRIESGWFLGVVATCALALPLTLPQAAVLIAVTGSWAWWHGRTMEQVRFLMGHVNDLEQAIGGRLGALETLTKDLDKMRGELSQIKNRGVIR
jgi:hypothetical protein